MSLMKFKDFTWPNNPHTYREVLSREPLYSTQNGATSYTGMSSTHRVITGSGVFFGKNAYADFRELLDMAEENSAGTLIHPEWGSRHCYFTKLELIQEPRENFVSYSFEFTQARPDGTVPK